MREIDYLRGMDKETFTKVMNDCIGKVEGLNDLDWQDIVDKYNMGIHRDVLRKSFQAPLGGYSIFKYFDEEKVENIEDNTILKEMEEKIKEFEKEKIRLQDQRREYKKYLRLDARFEHLVKTMEDEIKILANSKPLILSDNYVEYGDKEAVLVLSDWHIGVVNNNHWNKFNLEIAKERCGKLLSKTIQHCKLHKVNTIHVVILGDMANGYLHVGNRIENEEDVVSQIMTVSEMLAEFITELANNLNGVKVYTSTGNHGRCSANIKESLEVENFERLIPWYLKKRILSPDVEFVDNEIDDNIIVMKFLNEVIFATHGHVDKISSAINNLSRMLKVFPTEMMLGHYHTYKEFDEYDMTTTVNGTFSGTDEFAKKIRKSSSPMQVLAIYSEEGRECTYKIKLN